MNKSCGNFEKNIRYVALIIKWLLAEKVLMFGKTDFNCRTQFLPSIMVSSANDNDKHLN